MAESYKPYPACFDEEVGCRVVWRHYASEDAAKRAAEAAKHNAALDESRGFDFGFVSPGSIEKVERNGETVFRVCCA